MLILRCLNFKSDFNFFRKIFTALINQLTTEIFDTWDDAEDEKDFYKESDNDFDFVDENEEEIIS